MDDPRAAVHSMSRRGAEKMVFGKPVKSAPTPISRKMRPEEAFRILELQRDVLR